MAETHRIKTMKNEGIVLFKNLQQLTTAEIRVDRGVLGTRKSRGFFRLGLQKGCIGLIEVSWEHEKAEVFFWLGLQKGCILASCPSKSKKERN